MPTLMGVDGLYRINCSNAEVSAEVLATSPVALAKILSLLLTLKTSPRQRYSPSKGQDLNSLY